MPELARPSGHSSRLFSTFLLIGALTGWLASRAAALSGTWTVLAHDAPASVDLMLLLPDGTVMAAHPGGDTWYRLTPTRTGAT